MTEDDSSDIRENVMGSPGNPVEALGAVMDEGEHPTWVEAAALTVVTPGTLPPKPNVWNAQGPIHFYLYFPVRLCFSK